MRPSTCFWLAFCIIVGLCAWTGGAQAPAPTPDCNSALVSLLPCLDYVQGNVSAPPQNCCVGLGSVVKSNPICLCILFNSSALPIQVNTTRALQLPSLCSVTTPNSSVCGVSTPAPSTTAPTPPPTGTPPPAAASPGAPPTAVATPPQSAGTPTAATSPSTTPVLAPSVTPSVAPGVVPSVAPAIAPVVAPSVASPGPASGVPAPTPMGPSPVTSPMSAPAMTPTVPVSSPPAMTPTNYAAPIATVSLLSVVIGVSSLLFLQL